MKADFHMHSIYSDGTASSEELFALASKNHIGIISVTDHDTLEGRDVHMENARKYGVEYKPGVEISAYDYIHNKPVHIVGLEIVTDCYELNNLISKTLMSRHEISLRRIKELNVLGYNISLAEFSSERIKLGIYKQHIMEILIKKGHAHHYYGDFYQKNFKHKGPLDFQVDYPSHISAVKAIVAAGGKAILAHPGLYDNFDCIEDLVAHGLYGIECFYPSVTDEEQVEIRTIASQNNLYLSGGSDYHGYYADCSGGSIGDYYAIYMTNQGLL